MAGVQYVLHLLLRVLDEGPLRDLHGGDSLAVARVGGEFVLVAQQAVDESEGTLALRVHVGEDGATLGADVFVEGIQVLCGESVHNGVSQHQHLSVCEENQLSVSLGGG